jgi:hypothetical protein
MKVWVEKTIINKLKNGIIDDIPKNTVEFLFS